MSLVPMIQHTARTRILSLLRILTFGCGLATLGLLILVIGWPLTEAARRTVDYATTWILAVFVAQQLLRVVLHSHPWRFAVERRLEMLLTLAVALELLFGSQVASWVGSRTTVVSASTLALLFLAFNQLTLIGLIALRGLRNARILHSRSLTPGLVFIISFALLILVGTLLLKTPQATTHGISWTNALFLSTSAVCVTGLTPVDISTALTTHGQWVMLGLIQIGGLGVMTITYFFAYFMSGGVSLRSRIGLQDLLCEDNLGHIGMVLALIIGFTATIESMGAILIHASIADGTLPEQGRIFFSLFHSVSAFCNAGFSTLGPGLADPRVNHQKGFLGVIMALIVLGGLGFPVVKGFYTWVYEHVRYLLRLTRRIPSRLSANIRMVLWTTTALLAVGTVSIWLTEFAFAGGEVAGGSAWFTALFHSVTARTAGYNITSTGALLPATVAILTLLMFVGGSPSSTAGGIKTSTLAVAVLSLRRVLLGRKDIEAFHRRFGDDLANRALSIILVAASFVAFVTITLCVLHPELPPFDLLFESVSAIGTVGLSRDITPQLSAAAKLVLALAMLVGRVGVLTFLASFLPRPQRPALRYPETTIVLN